MTLHFLNDVADDTESKQKYVIIASLKSKTMGKMMNTLLKIFKGTLRILPLITIKSN